MKFLFIVLISFIMKNEQMGPSFSFFFGVNE
jgi:hypothetical protein